jgi:drug/metabolite transporter (DMT)-like permease
MIYYLIIILAVICFATQFVFTKLFQGCAKQTAQTSLVMLFFANVVGAILFLCISGFKLNFTLPSLIFAILMACIMIPYYMLGIKALSLGTLAIYSMFMMLGGMLVPFFYGIIFLDEAVSVGKIIGSILMTVCIVLQALWQKSEPSASGVPVKKGTKYLFFLVCIAIFFINGFSGVISKSHAVSENTAPETSFMFTSCALTSLLSAIILLITLLINRQDGIASVRSVIKVKPIVISALLGIAAYMGNFLLLVAADKVPASVQFPMISGGTIALSSVVSLVLFKEKLSAKEWISVAGAFASTFLFVF